jgi:hypothetical protein
MTRVGLRAEARPRVSMLLMAGDVGFRRPCLANREVLQDVLPASFFTACLHDRVHSFEHHSRSF